MGSSLTIPTTSTGTNIPIFALDANQDLILAAYADSATTTLSASSTAVTLVLMALGPLPSSGPTFSQVVQNVQSTNGYATLVQSIDAALTAGTPPLQSTLVVQNVVTVASQSSQMLASESASSAVARAQTATMPSTQVTNQLPFQIVGSSLSTTQWSVYTTSATSSGGLNVVNSMPIEWYADSFDQDGTSFYDPGSEVILDAPVTFLDGIGTYTTAGSLLGNGAEFSVTLSQTEQTEQANINQDIADTMTALVGLLTQQPPGVVAPCSDQVSAAIANTLFTANGLAGAPTGGEAGAIVISNFTAGTLYQAVKTAFGCLQINPVAAIANLSSYVVPYVGWVHAFIGLIEEGNSIADTVGLIEPWYLTLHYWNESISDGVCEGPQNGAYVIVNCAHSFTIAAPSTLVVGASAPVQIQALDANMNPTLYDSYNTLSWTALPQDPSIVTLSASQSSASGQEVTGTSAGTATVTVTDPYTMATGSGTVTVALAQATVSLSVSPSLAHVGSPVTFSITVSPSSANGSAPPPAGSVAVEDSTGTTLCTAQLDASASGTCSYIFSNAGTVAVSAVFSEALIYVTATSNTVAVTVTDLPFYSLTDLGTLGGTESFGTAINASGQVTGYSYTSGNAAIHAFLYTGSMVDLQLAAATSYPSCIDSTDTASYGYGLNDSGEVVGQCYPGVNGDGDAFLYSNGVMVDFGPQVPCGDLYVCQGEGFGEAWAINDSGQMTGTASVAAGTTTLYPFDYPFVCDTGGGCLSLNSSAVSQPYYYNVGAGLAINSNGEVAGYESIQDNTGSSNLTAFIWDGNPSDAAQLLSTLGGTESYALGINATGQVTGWSTTASGAEHAFLQSNDSMLDLGTLGGTASVGQGINASGEVTGYYSTPSNVTHAFIWSNEQMVDLNALLDPSNALAPYVTLQEGFGINDSGWIVADGVDSRTNQTHAYVLVPEQ